MKVPPTSMPSRTGFIGLDAPPLHVLLGAEQPVHVGGVVRDDPDQPPLAVGVVVELLGGFVQRGVYLDDLAVVSRLLAGLYRRFVALTRLRRAHELGDAQVHRFDPAGFDVAISRFGTMFFSDPAAAFANIAAALRPAARLVLLVWQRREDNQWALAIDAALGDAARLPQPGAEIGASWDRVSTNYLQQLGVKLVF